MGQVREAIQRERSLRASRAIAKNGASGTSIPVSNSDSIAVGILEDYHVPDRAAFNSSRGPGVHAILACIADVTREVWWERDGINHDVAC